MRSTQGRFGTFREYLTNMQVEMPLPRKLYLLVRNAGIRIVRLQDCCGHPGQPGC